MSRRLLVLVLMTTTALAGCSTCHKAGYGSQKPPCACSQYAPPVRMMPIGVPPRPPAAFNGVAPSPAPVAPPVRETTPPPPAGEQVPTAPPPASIDQPIPQEGTTTPLSVQVGPPGSSKTEVARIPDVDATRQPPASLPKAPDVDESRDPPQPTDVPGYVVVRPNVATGLKPFPDGIAWLQERGYKAVLHLRPPGEDNAAAKRQFEKKGLKYLSIEVSAKTLTKEVYDAFVSDVTATANHPLFVYDRNGASISALWYLFYRVKLNFDDDKALAEVKRIGLKLDDDDDHKKAWLAAQTLLGTLKP